MTIGQVSFHTRRCHPARVSGKAVADDAGLAMATATDPAQVERLRQIADQAMTLEMATERTHLESIERTRIGASEIARHRDGIDLHGPIFWWGQRLGFYTRDKARQPGTFAYQAGLDYTKSWTESVVAFGWITSGDNERATQLATGRAYVLRQPTGELHGRGDAPFEPGAAGISRDDRTAAPLPERDANAGRSYRANVFSSGLCGGTAALTAARPQRPRAGLGEKE